jgi:hypothetical protein
MPPARKISGSPALTRNTSGDEFLLDRPPDFGVGLAAQPMVQPPDGMLGPDEAHRAGSGLAHVRVIVLEAIGQDEFDLGPTEPWRAAGIGEPAQRTQQRDRLVVGRVGKQALDDRADRGSDSDRRGAGQITGPRSGRSSSRCQSAGIAPATPKLGIAPSRRLPLSGCWRSGLGRGSDSSAKDAAR